MRENVCYCGDYWLVNLGLCSHQTRKQMTDEKACYLKLFLFVNTEDMAD